MSSSTLDTRNVVQHHSLPQFISVVHTTSSRCELIFQVLDPSTKPNVFGVALCLSKKGALDAVALSTLTDAFLINIDVSGASSNCNLAHILEHPCCLLAGFNMSHLALILNRNINAHVYAIDLSTFHASSTREQMSAADVVYKNISQRAQRHKIHSLWLRTSNDDLCLRAWLSACIAEKGTKIVQTSRKVDTRHLQPHQLACLSQLAINMELLDAARPTMVDNEFEKLKADDSGKLILHNSRFKTRVRPSSQTIVEIYRGHSKMTAKAVSSHGKTTGLVLHGRQQHMGGRSRKSKQSNGPGVDAVTRVCVVGREEATCAERSRDEFVLRVLRGEVPFAAPLFIRKLWFPVRGKAACRKALSGANLTLRETSSFAKLNNSQAKVACAMISDGEPLVVAHGPPGTGKTTTIAAALEYWQKNRQPTWVVAQSNVGVKNIARSLFKKGVCFKLIVSKEFHFEWHEHIYAGIEHCVMSSDEFGAAFDAKNYIGDIKIILCTLSMLSNPALDLNGIFRHVPVERLVVDEASQIDSYEFMHLFHKFGENLHKVCMFGDPKQLPPYGLETAPKMKTIFDFRHLQGSSYFLDTQYRMPVLLGSFISMAIYDSKLLSEHHIKDSRCVVFVDVRKGKEEKMGSSWKNTEEAHTIVNIVEKYYLREEFCIITPYDAQRATITEALKRAYLPHEQVYNVDSFQGHEAAYVIVSPVRTESPGFLRSNNRANVMLTRCQKGMVVVTQRDFLRQNGRQTLLGRLAVCWEKRTPAAWVDAMQVADGRAMLPGVGGPKGRDAITLGVDAHESDWSLRDELSANLRSLSMD